MLNSLLTELPKNIKAHQRCSPHYDDMARCVKHEIAQLFTCGIPQPLNPFGNLIFPFFEMGAINSLDLFGLDELILFSFYWANRTRYHRALDIGANLGLHSIIMSRCGFKVTAFEPDAFHFSQLVHNLEANQVTEVTPIQGAVSTFDGTSQFIRVLGNTTASHLKGSRSCYGDLEVSDVKVYNFSEQISNIDLIKMDVEGHEASLILSTTFNDWKNMDAVLEVGSPENAESIYKHLKLHGIHAFAQKCGWEKVCSLNDMPVSHRDGSLFISTKEMMPW